MATCQAELGEATAALTTLRGLIVASPGPAGFLLRHQAAVIMAGLGRITDAVAGLDYLLAGMHATPNADAPELAGVVALRNHLRQLAEGQDADSGV